MRARHILVEYQGWWPPSRRHVERSKEDAYQMAVELRLRILSGESFADLARVHSECPSGADGGDLGHFLPGDMDPAFEAAVKETAVGEVAQLTRTQFGWHVIQRLD
ncbi:MAG: peptidylprolyl isomerase [Myxococcota bacterium]